MGKILNTILLLLINQIFNLAPNRIKLKKILCIKYNLDEHPKFRSPHLVENSSYLYSQY